MELLYSNKKTEKVCTDSLSAQKFFGGNKALALSLLARINALKQAETIKDIIEQKHFHFHNLTKKRKKDLKGYFAIDVKSRKDSWRLILEPLDHSKRPYYPCEIDKISDSVRIVEIVEVSNHYE